MTFFELLSHFSTWLYIVAPLLLCTGLFYAGKAASVTIAATTRPYDTWKFSHKCEIVSTLNFTSSGYEESLAGVFEIDGAFSGPYDGSEAIAPGDSVACTLAAGGGGPSLVITMRLGQFDVETTVRGKITLGVTGKSNGSHSLTY